MTRSALALAALLAAVPLPVAAADPAPAPALEYTTPAPPPPPDVAGLVVRLVGLTAALLLLCGGVAWAARRANRPTLPAGDAGGRIRHEGTLALDGRCSVHLLRVDGQAVAVTTDATGLRSVVLLSEPFEVEFRGEPSA